MWLRESLPFPRSFRDAQVREAGPGTWGLMGEAGCSCESPAGGCSQQLLPCPCLLGSLLSGFLEHPLFRGFFLLPHPDSSFMKDPHVLGLCPGPSLFLSFPLFSLYHTCVHTRAHTHAPWETMHSHASATCTVPQMAPRSSCLLQGSHCLLDISLWRFSRHHTGMTLLSL